MRQSISGKKRSASTTRISKSTLTYKLTKYSQFVYTSFAFICTVAFALWWFRIDHLPTNFTGPSRVIDVLLFLLVSYIIWHPILMEVLTWSISAHVKNIRKKKPSEGLKVAFITTIVPSSESLSLLHKCLPAMKNTRYPHDTWLLDEGNSEEVKKICRQYNVKHFSRADKEGFVTKKGKFTRTKGGNHNAWYELHGNKYDIVAQIDTDFVPKKSFLTKTLGYFRDPKIAFVGTPQIYGNTTESLVAKGAAEQLYSFYGSVLRGLSSINTTLLIGANHVIRVNALKDINHYSAHITEDLITGMKLHSKGWKSIYISDPLAIGEGPATWEAYFSQQMRWAYGCMDIFFKKSHKITKHMGFLRSIYYFFLQQHYFAGIAMAASTVLLSLYFFTGLRAADVDLLKFFIFYTSILLICWLMSVWLQRYNVYRKNEGEFLLAGKIVSIAAWPIWFLAFFCVLTGKKIKYKVTPKGEGEAKQSSLSIFIPHLIFGFIALICIISSFYTHRQNAAMMFWAITSTVLMFTIPFSEKIFQITRSAKYKLTAYSKYITTEFNTLHKKYLHKNSQKYFLKPLALTISEMREKERQQKEYRKIMLKDCAFLALIVILSFVLNIGDIGFYSDDWSFLGNFALSKDQSLLGLIKTAFTPNTLMRPVQNIYDALLYWLFGTNPLGYQLVNAGVLTATTLLFALILKKLSLPRILTVAIPLVFALLPNYSTDRFWYAAFQVNLSMMFYFFSLYSALRAFSQNVILKSTWKIISIAALILSALSYEVILPLYILNVLILWDPARNFFKEKNKKVSERKKPIVFISIIFISLLYVFVFKLLTTIRLGGTTSLDYILGVITQSFHVHYIQLGLNLPSIWGQAISLYTDPYTLALTLFIFLSVFYYLYSILTERHSSFPSVVGMGGLIVASVVIFFLGYSIFFTNNQVGYSPLGIDNRVAIAASAGIAFTVVGGVGFATKLLPQKISRLFFALFIALFCTGSFLTLQAISSFWGKSYQKSQSVLTSIHQKFPNMQKNTTLILDGVCPYQGPAPVFEARWDLKGALQLRYRDKTIEADIVTPRMEVKNNGIYTQIYGFHTRYPYKNLIIYNYDNNSTHKIKNEKQAKNYFQKYNPDMRGGCPPAEPGKGAPIFS